MSIVLIPATIVIILGCAYAVLHFRAIARAGQQEWAVKRLGLARPAENRLWSRFQDQDGNLVADLPGDAADLVSPETIYFSYIPGASSGNDPQVWQGVCDVLSQATGRPLEYLRLDTVEEQMEALRGGRLHVTGINTGSVPMAVNSSGFVPVCTPGDAEGGYGYTMKMIVPAGSDIEQMEQLRGRRITFTSRDSNSGFKAPIVLLMYDFGLQPDRDYSYGFSTSHDESIRRIAAGELEVAPVASDMIERAVQQGDIERAAFRVIYTSERFPPAAIGYVYNLSPDLASAIRKTLVGFEIQDTTIDSIFSPRIQKLVPISYKDDWALIRRIDNALGIGHEQPLPRARRHPAQESGTDSNR